MHKLPFFYITLFIVCLAQIEAYNKTVLITGGSGYVGSATTLYMIQQGYRAIVIDHTDFKENFADIEPVILNNFFDTTTPFDKTKKLYFIKSDYADERALSFIFNNFKIDAIIHFAAFLNVGESVKKPEMYYENNVEKTIRLLKVMKKNHVNKLVFSSSCTVYGNGQYIPIDEKHPKNPISPYGRSKLMIETILEDYSKSSEFQAISLRYFNAAGGLPEYNIGEQHDPEIHLIPLLLKAGLENKPFYIFGDTYPTPDGTCIRDYLHIWDLASAHYLALQYLEKDIRFDVFNLGTGTGYSVKEVMNCVEKIIGKKIIVQIVEPRQGDAPAAVADVHKAQLILGWEPIKSSLDEIIHTAYKYYLLTNKT